MLGRWLAGVMALGLATQALALDPSLHPFRNKSVRSAMAPVEQIEGPADPAHEPLVAIEVMSSLSSQTSHRGDLFPIRLVEPVKVDGKQVLAAGALGVGEVIEAKPARGGGTPGILTLGLRYLEAGGRQLPLRLGDPVMMGRNQMAGDLKKAERNLVLAPVRSLPLNLVTVFREGGEVMLPAQTRVAALLSWSPPEAKPAPEGKRSPALVVFFRPSTFSWSAIGCTVSENGRKISSLGNGRWFAMTVAPGTHVFRATGETRDELRMDLAPGQVAYVECRMRMSALIARPTLVPSQKGEYGAEKLRMVNEDDMVPPGGPTEAGAHALRGEEVMALPPSLRP